MQQNRYEIAREIIQNRIKYGLIGPGSDSLKYSVEVEEEIISDYPLIRYYSGVIFPDKDIKSVNDSDEIDLRNETEEDDEETTSDFQHENSFKPSKENVNSEKENDDISQNTFFPTNFALTFCINPSIREIEVEFNFGLYKQLKENQVKIKIEQTQFQEFISQDSIIPIELRDLLIYDNGYLKIKRELKGNKGGRGKTRDGEYLYFDQMKKQFPHRVETQKLEKLLGRAWQRVPKKETKTIPIQDTDKIQTIFEEAIGSKQYIKVGYTLKTYQIEGNPNKYVKVQIVNCSTKQSHKKFSNKQEDLNQKCIFQSEIVVKNINLQSYKAHSDLHPFDNEAKILNYLYKDVKSFGIGHNCSVIWETTDNPSWIKTSFLPEYDIKDTKNSFTKSDFKNPKDFEILNESLDIQKLSFFNSNSNEIYENCKSFIRVYADWIEEQKRKTDNTEEFGTILKNISENYNRLNSNIELLKNKDILKAFQLANTAMLIQIIISNDKEFAGKEKELSEIKNTEYKNIEFFKSYISNEALKQSKNPEYKPLIPKYRPFQLAFILLSLDSIVNPKSVQRDIVDLIWFPTGGGKTEAYLAVTALAIIWRRMTNLKGYEGTTVIMRYTLRLLTAQQFERASKLIAVLEFLRKFHSNLLKSEPITIGMWVGQASTPNINDIAVETVEKIEKECNSKKGEPTKYNIFQLSSCPYCGTKLISKDKADIWQRGFDVSEGKFYIHCINPSCFFHEKLPIQVVDELLYQQPPTLLFGTVDKFAMLAWQENGHRFFNSLNPDGLPPDLIIQDELHLLNGPLGSITGFYESMIDMLCTKDKRKPKIISSTATTRNTKQQIKALFNREVNVFPPSGLNFKDSFFAKVSEDESKRRYVSIMPTGKTIIDTQLQVLAHLIASRIEIYKEFSKSKDFNIIDNYWTLTSYYNSLKDVGKIANKTGDEISNFSSTLQIRLNGENKAYTFNYYGLANRVQELTSRIESSEIKATLKELEENRFTDSTILHKTSKNGTEYTTVENIVDLVLATNMLSVGIDIERLNVMLINSQPRNIAEYIQASSRIGRKYKGLVIDLLDANRARDKSHFEHFIPFHQAFYKSVEPLTVTPFTENTIEKMLTTLFITYQRHTQNGMCKNKDAINFDENSVIEFKDFIKQRFDSNEAFPLFEKRLNEIVCDWKEKQKEEQLFYQDVNTKFMSVNGLLKRPQAKVNDKGEDFEDINSNLWLTMQSMREIDTNSFINILIPNPKSNGIE